MRLRDIFENVHQLAPQDPHGSYVRRIEGGDMAVLDEIKQLPIDTIQAIGSKVAKKQVKQRKAMEEITRITVDNAMHNWRMKEIDRITTPSWAKDEPKHWEPSQDTGPKVVPFRKGTSDVSEAVDGIDMGKLEHEGRFDLADKAWKWINGEPPKFDGSARQFNLHHGTETPREGMRMIRKLIDTILIDNDPKAAEALYKEMVRAPGNAASVFYHALQGMPDTTTSTALLNGIRGR